MRERSQRSFRKMHPRFESFREPQQTQIVTSYYTQQLKKYKKVGVSAIWLPGKRKVLGSDVLNLLLLEDLQGEYRKNTILNRLIMSPVVEWPLIDVS